MEKNTQILEKTKRKYAKLGRFIIERVYNRLYYNSCTNYRDLKRYISLILKEDRPLLFIDKNFAWHKYNHGNSKLPDSCKYRWENVMRFYIDQHIEAGLLYRSEKNKAIIGINPPTFIALADGAKHKHQMFNEARTILRQQYEDKKNGR